MARREALRITAVAGLGVAFGGGLTAGILRDARLHRVRRTRTHMGTLVTLTAVHPDVGGAGEMITAGFDEIARLERLLSRHRPDATLARLNAAGRSSDTPSELLTVLSAALDLAAATAGAFDPTVLPLLTAYTDTFGRHGRAPTATEVASALCVVDHRRVHVVGEDVVLEQPEMALTLDGIAKGFVVDRTAEALVSLGAERVLVDAGGDMAAAGEQAHRHPWTVGIQDPHDTGRGTASVHLADRGVATSGDYQNSFTVDRRHHHILDPRTGRSPDALSSVSVVAPTAMLADGLSTAAMVLGPVAGLDLLERRSGVEGLMVTKTGERLRTHGLDAGSGRVHG